MRVLRDIPISLTSEYVLEEMYHRRSTEAHERRQKPTRPWMMEVTKEAVGMSEALVAPVAICDEFPVRSVAGEQVYLEGFDVSAQPNGDGPGQQATVADSVRCRGKQRTESATVLSVGSKADLLAPADRVMVAVLTIGPALEQRVRELYSSDQDLLAYVLDSVGVLALGAVGEAFRRMAEERAAELGWGVSPALSPGSLVGWPVTGQRELCALLPVERIGVKLNNHSVLEPHKSASVVIGLGPGYESAHVGSLCRYCSLADTCWRRRGSVA